MHSNWFWIRGSSSSRSIALSELHWFFVRYRACFLLEGEVWGDFPGLCKILHETTPLVVVWNHMGGPSCIPVFSYVSRYRSTSCLLVDDGSYWSTMVSGGLDLILQCWSAGTSCAPRFRPWVAVKTSGEPDEPPLRWSFFIISSMFFGLEFTQVGVHGTIEWFGLPRSRHLSLRRSVHDAGFVCDR